MLCFHKFKSIRFWYTTIVPDGSDTPDKDGDGGDENGDGGDENGEDEYENLTVNEASVAPFETSITESFLESIDNNGLITNPSIS